MGTCVNGQAIEVIVRATVDRIIDFEEIFAGSRRGEVDQRTCKFVTSYNEQLSGWRVELQDAVQPRVNRSADQFGQHALPLLQWDLDPVDIGGTVRAAVDQGIKFDLGCRIASI